MPSIHRIARASAVGVGALASAAFAVTPALGTSSFIEQFHKIRTVASTVPGNGDVNPYGVAVVRHTTGSLVKGNVLVSNFNNNGPWDMATVSVGGGRAPLPLGQRRPGHAPLPVSVGRAGAFPARTRDTPTALSS